MGPLKIRVKKIQVFCVLGAVLIFLLLEITGGGERILEEGRMLRRSSPGQGPSEVEVYVKGLVEEKEVPVMITVGERRYTEEEAEELYPKVLSELKNRILGENESLEEIRSDLTLMSSMNDYGLNVSWESSNLDLVDEFGCIHNRQAPREGEEVYLRACLTDGLHEAEYDIKIRVFPPVRSEEEEAVESFQSLTETFDREQRTKDYLVLPEAYEDRRLGYRTKSTSDYGFIPVLGILIAVLLKARDEMAVKQLDKLRKQQLLLDYSELVSKLMVFIGAGMTVRLAWEKITGDYEAGVRSGKRSARYAYEEMCVTARQMKSGEPESLVYGEFGRRCGLQPYMKLGSLLEQNRKTGMKNLKNTLQAEMMSAFEQRKNLAVRLGEEAGTKLLLPLFLMLGIVMVMIVVPAFLSFS